MTPTQSTAMKTTVWYWQVNFQALVWSIKIWPNTILLKGSHLSFTVRSELQNLEAWAQVSQDIAQRGIKAPAWEEMTVCCQTNTTSWWTWVYSNRVVHGKHFGAIFGSFSASFLAHFHVFGRRMIWMIWKMKGKMLRKMATVNTPESKNEAKMHFTLSSAVLASAQHIQTPPQMT